MIGLLLVLLQAQQFTVGDTLWASRSVRLSPGDSVRPATWELEGPVQLLGRPDVVMEGDRALVRYPLVAWEAGDHTVDIPGPIITRASGAEDTLQVETVTLRVTSVLPVGVPESLLAVQPPANLVARGFRSVLPPLVLGALAALLLVPLHWWWGRRRKPAPPDAPQVTIGLSEDVVHRWAEAGEPRVVAAAAAMRLRGVIARAVPSAHAGLDTAACLAEIRAQRPDWPYGEIAETLTALDAVRFAPSTRLGSFELYQRGIELARSLSGAPS